MIIFLRYFILLIIPINLYAQTPYILKAGDIINIHIYDEKKLDLTTKIDESGIIIFPFIGEVKVINRSTKDISKFISSELKNGYFINPEVHVSIVEYRPFYINGQVKKPGGFPYQPNITVAMGIALAGGLTDRASGSKWFIKKNSNNRYKVTGESFISPGDILIIEQSFF